MPEEMISDAKFIDVDLDQWRRDISTFAESTQTALDSIVDELSNVVGGRNVAPRPARNPPTVATNKSNNSRSTSGGPITNNGRPPKQSTSAADRSSGNRETRLTSIKEKLASRLAKNN